jgi:acyl carrier protein
MTSDDLRRVVVEALTRIAPEIDPASIEAATAFRDQLDLDSMDFLNFVLELHDRLHVDIPETDYPRLSSLDGAVTYLAARVGEKAPAATVQDNAAPRL